MLDRPDLRGWAAINALRSHPEFPVFEKYLQDALQHLYATSAVQRDDTLSRWHQGAAQAVADLIEMFDKAPDIHHKSR